MKILNLSKEEKEEVLDCLIELFQDTGYDVFYLDNSMAKLMNYLDFKVPQTLEITTSDGDESLIDFKVGD